MVVIDIVCRRTPLYKAARERTSSGRLGSQGRGASTKENGLSFGKTEELQAVRKRAVHERPAARLFPRQAARPGRTRSCGSSKLTLQTLQEENVNHPDLADRASSETDRAIELRARDRQRKLISKIDAALQRIEDNSYGYCEETGEPISLKRLEARPIATLSVEAQERHEKREKVYRDE